MIRDATFNPSGIPIPNPVSQIPPILELFSLRFIMLLAYLRHVSSSTNPPSENSRPARLSDLPKAHLAAAAMLTGFAAFMTWDQSYWWANREDYSFGYLVPLFVGYVLYDRWPKISRFFIRGQGAEQKPAAEHEEASHSGLTGALEGFAVLMFLGALSLFVVGAFLRTATGPENLISLAIATSFCAILLCSVFLFSKEAPTGEAMDLRSRIGLTVLFLFPAMIWMLSAPLVGVLETQVRVFLLNKVTVAVFGLLDFLGFALEREGNILILPDGQVGVEEACSGIRSLTACLFAGSFLAAVFLDRFWKKFALVGAAMCLAVMTNLMRSMFLTLWAYYNGSGAIDEDWILPVIGSIGTVHDATGMLILVVTCIGLLCLLPIFNFKLDDFDEDEGPVEASSNS